MDWLSHINVSTFNTKKHSPDVILIPNLIESNSSFEMCWKWNAKMYSNFMANRTILFMQIHSILQTSMDVNRMCIYILLKGSHYQMEYVIWNQFAENIFQPVEKWGKLPLRQIAPPSSKWIDLIWIEKKLCVKSRVVYLARCKNNTKMTLFFSTWTWDNAVCKWFSP